MSCCVVKKCCCGCDLTTGTLAIGYVELCMQGYDAINWLLCLIFGKHKLDFTDVSKGIIMIKFISGVFLTKNIISFSFSIVLLLSVYKKKTKLTGIYIIYKIIEFITTIVIAGFSATTLSVVLSKDLSTSAIWFFCLSGFYGCLILSLDVYFIIVINSYYQELLNQFRNERRIRRLQRGSLGLGYYPKYSDESDRSYTRNIIGVTARGVTVTTSPRDPPSSLSTPPVVDSNTGGGGVETK